MATAGALLFAATANATVPGRAVDPLTSFGFGSALVGSTPVGNGPAALAINQATHTIYVENGQNANGPNAGGNTISVIDARRCSALDISHCSGPWATVTVGNLPSGIAIDVKTDTVYVTNLGDNTVSVFDGATCNGENTSGCGQTPATVPVGSSPVGLFADPLNHTVYIPNSGQNDVSVLDSATCNATDLAACPSTAPPSVTVGGTPLDVDVNQATHTAYVTTIGALNGWTVFDADTCNATVQSGCGALGYLNGDPIGPSAAEVDPANATLYTANFDNTVSAFDLRHCNASDLVGCATETPGTLTPFPDPGFGDNVLWVAVDAPLHSVYAVYQRDAALVVVDTNVCNGRHLSACASLQPATIHTGGDPEMVRLDTHTQTLYTANEVDNDVSVIDARRCNAQVTSGCRHRPPAVNVPQPGGIAADAAAHTAYVTTGSHAVAMIDTRHCNATGAAGCMHKSPRFAVGNSPVAIAVDRHTHTVYVADYGAGAAGAISVLDERTCNAGRTTDCTVLHTLRVPGGNPDDLALDPATGTLYAATIAGGGPDLVSVFDAATCNAEASLGCGLTPASLEVGNSGGGFSTLSVAVNQATNTLYATNLVTAGTGQFAGSSVYVINGATCDAQDTSGCNQVPDTIMVPSSAAAGSTPVGIAVDQATDTIYTADLDGGESAGTVAVINGATCNGQDTSGCGQTPVTVPVGFGAEGVAIDAGTHDVYVNNIEDASVSVIDGATCNGQSTAGCSTTAPKIAVGDYPGAALTETKQLSNSSQPIAVDPTTATAYIQNIDGVSVIPLARQR
jgi:DNA-binding beta-propeller fold protein YncE